MCIRDRINTKCTRCITNSSKIVISKIAIAVKVLTEAMVEGVVVSVDVVVITTSSRTRDKASIRCLEV